VIYEDGSPGIRRNLTRLTRLNQLNQLTHVRRATEPYLRRGNLSKIPTIRGEGRGGGWGFVANAPKNKERKKDKKKKEKKDRRDI
jgi:hypothetical protein